MRKEGYWHLKERVQRLEELAGIAVPEERVESLTIKRKRVVANLTPRHKQIIQLICAGKSTKEIADELGLKDMTVRSYRKDLMERLGVHTIAEVVIVGFSTGLVRLEEEAAA